MANKGQLGTVYEASGKLYLRYTAGDGAKRSVFLCPAKGAGKLDKAGLEKRKLEMLTAAGLTGEMPEELKQGINFKSAGADWLRHSMTRKRNPISSATAKGYSSYLIKLNSMIAEVSLAQVTNKTAKGVVEKLSAEGLSAKTITEIIAVLKYVVASILDENGGQVYLHQWNHEFMDLPVIGKQNQPAFLSEQVTGIVGAARERKQEREAVLFALLGGSGMRIGEMLAIKLGPQSDDATTISADCRTIYVRKSVFGQTEQHPKTQAAIREIDLAPELAALIKSYVGDRKKGWLFSSDTGKPLLQRNILRDSLHPILIGRKARQTYRKVNGKMVKHILLPEIQGVTGKKMGFHAFRRFRTTHLRAEGMPEDLVMFWLGHKEKTITDRYSKMKERLELRKEWAERAGLGFKLPGAKIVEMAVKSKKEKESAA
jgi:integrase